MIPRLARRLLCALLIVAALSSFASAEDDESDKAFASFLESCDLQRGDIYFDRALTLYGKESARMLLASGKGTQYLAALSDEGGFVYVEMPWHARGDLLDARILDLAGDGRQALIFRYRERGSDGDARERLGIWRLPSESHIRRVFAADVSGSGVRFLRRGRANDVVIAGGSAKGRYQFAGDQYQRVR